MVTFESIKNHFDTMVAKGENAPTTAKNYTNTIFRICNDLDGLEDIAKCCNEGVVEYINLTFFGLPHENVYHFLLYDLYD